jgi:multidrug efflux pump subunit AcrA (membrane-fusion protein)
VIEIDALPGVEFKTQSDKSVAVSRWSDAEDPTTRTMRTEVDVPNPAGTLRHGMYGRATLILSEGTPNAFRVPSAALAGKSEGGRGAVRIVRDGKVHLVPVRYATDNGVEVEVVTGLTAGDRVIVRTSGPVEEGAAVAVGGEVEK